MCVLPLSYEPIDLFVIWTDWGPLRGAQAVEDEKKRFVWWDDDVLDDDDDDYRNLIM